MTRTTRFAVVFMAFLFAAAPSLARAAGVLEQTRSVWMAAVDQRATQSGHAFGKLSLEDGVLSFRSLNGLRGWQLAIADTKRIAASKRLHKTFEIESVSGEVFYVVILNTSLVTDSPKQALQVLGRAMKASAADPRRLMRSGAISGPAAAPAGSTKVVRLDGGQIR
ncbi:MAG: hypothetical protein ABI665_27950 [Vicinamibacterales bacterium]